MCRLSQTQQSFWNYRRRPLLGTVGLGKYMLTRLLFRSRLKPLQGLVDGLQPTPQELRQGRAARDQQGAGFACLLLIS